MDDRGFEILPGVLAPMDCDRVLASLASAEGRTRAGARHLMSHPGVRQLAQSRTLMDLARAHLGPGAAPYRATLFEKSGEKNWLVVWHQDTTLPLISRTDSPEWGPWSTKGGILYAHAPTWALENIVAIRVHLDASTAGNGPLRIIPGSHRGGVLSDESVFKKARESASVDCLVGRGGVLALRPLLIHASSKAEGPMPRRVLHLEYAASLTLKNGMRIAMA